MTGALNLSPLHARRFHRRAVLLDNGVAEIGAALAHHGYIQIDPINVCGRMHDLILRNRVRDYREGDLIRHLHGDKAAKSPDRKSTRLNSSHDQISYAVFCLKKKKQTEELHLLPVCVSA